MVTFICDDCSECLKKKQIENHINYCGSNFSCVDCKVRFSFNLAKNHTLCLKEKIEDLNQIPIGKLIKNVKYYGFRRSLRKILKNSPEKKLEKKKLKHCMRELLKNNDKKRELSIFQELFDFKLDNAKNIIKQGIFLKYKIN